MNMYVAQAKNGRFEIVENLGAIDPDEAMVPVRRGVRPETDSVVSRQLGCRR
jgi:hypothetical protein